jgi:hypothetical protein
MAFDMNVDSPMPFAAGFNGLPRLRFGAQFRLSEHSYFTLAAGLLCH